MAGANLPAKKYSKKSPTVTRLSFECTGGQVAYIDIAQALSAVNRRFYRQGVYYYVNSVEIYNNETGVVDLLTLPDTWVTKNAHQRGFKLFQKMNALVDPVSGVGRPKYHDFKVRMDAAHATSGNTLPEMYGATAGTVTLTTDDWEYSKFTSADDDQDAVANADEFFVHMVGDHDGAPTNWTSVGLIKSYGDSRSTVQAESPEDFNIQSDDPLINVFDFSSEEQMNDIIDNLLVDNDNPPYDFNEYVGEQSTHLQHVARIGTEVGVGRVGRAAGFCVPFGLLMSDASAITTAYRVVLNLAVGTYHGVYAERA